MDIVTATKIIQDQATVNGTSFDDEFWHIANNLKTVPKEVYRAWTLFHNSTNQYFSRAADRERIKQLARDMKKLTAGQRNFFDTL